MIETAQSLLSAPPSPYFKVNLNQGRGCFFLKPNPGGGVYPSGAAGDYSPPVLPTTQYNPT